MSSRIARALQRNSVSKSKQTNKQKSIDKLKGKIVTKEKILLIWKTKAGPKAQAKEGGRGKRKVGLTARKYHSFPLP